MPTPPPWPLVFARRLTALSFWPFLIGTSGSAALVLAFVLAIHPWGVWAGTILLVTLAAALFAITRRFRWRMPPMEVARAAVAAAMMLATGASLPLGMAVFSMAGIDSALALAALTTFAVGQLAAVFAFRWSTAET